MSKISSIKKAIKITEAGMRAAKRNIRVGISERQLASKIEQAMRTAGTDWYAFPTIVVAHNYKNIHATPTDYKIRKTDTVIVDIGAKVEGHCADMTRTFCLSPTEKTKKLYNLVKSSQELSASQLKPRAKARLVDKVARLFLKKHKLKIPHSLGHGVGKKVHERPSLKPRSRDKLKLGDVVTIEPGIYLQNVGIRIEDMYLITKRGAKKLTNFSYIL